MSTIPRDVLCPKCWKRDPLLTQCNHCGENGCEACLLPLEGGEATCGDCWIFNLSPTERKAMEEESGTRCPNCGELANFTEHEGSFTETHGLDCGPYETWTEHWLTCDKCGAKTDDAEIAAAQGVI